MSHRFKVVLDPGHGGRDPGAVDPVQPAQGDNLHTRECDVTLDVAKRIKQYLAPVMDVVLTRDTDRDFCPPDKPWNQVTDLRERGKIINASGAQCSVSVHCNSLATAPQAHGLEVYYHPTKPQDKGLAKAVLDELIKTTGLTNRGVKTDNLALIRYPKMPSCLVELPFVSNPEEERLLNSPTFRDQCAKAIARGIAAWAGMKLEVVDVPEISKTEQEYGEKALDSLAKKGFVANPETWKQKLGEPVPNWLFFVMLDRVTK